MLWPIITIHSRAWLIITIHSRADTIATETQLSKPATERLADEVVIVQNLKHPSNSELRMALYFWNTPTVPCSSSLPRSEKQW
jgi:hypothetical protein